MPYDLNIPGQVSEYELRAIELVAGILPKNGHMVEVGSLFGRSSYAWAKSCDPSVSVHCIDPWEGNEGVRPIEERLGITYGLECFKTYTADCANVVPRKGYSPIDFKDWSTPLDLYFEDAVHVDPILSQNVDFWSAHLKPSGILCGDDYRPRFPDVRAAAERMAAHFGRRLQVVDFFWCLLPPEDELPGVKELSKKLDELAEEYRKTRQEACVVISMKPGGALTGLRKANAVPVDVVLTNDGSNSWPKAEQGPARLSAKIRSTKTKEDWVRVADIALTQGPLDHDIAQTVTVPLVLRDVTSDEVDLQFSLAARDGSIVATSTFPALTFDRQHGRGWYNFLTRAWQKVRGGSERIAR